MSQLSAAFAITVLIFGCYGAQWGEQFSSCDGKFKYANRVDQSDECIVKEFTGLIVKGFNVPATSAELKNNGQTLLINLKFTETPTIKGGPLEGVYKFSHFQFHWFDADSVSPRYRILNISYPIELHMVFFNQKYASANQAQIFPNGIAVLAFSIKIQDDDSEEFKELIGLIDNVRQPNNSASFVNPLQLKNLMIKYIIIYYTYIGTMLTPPCDKEVIWIDFENQIGLSVQQYSALDTFGDKWSMRENPNLRETIYYRELPRLQAGPGGAIPLSYARNKANEDNHIAVMLWILLLSMLEFC